MKSVYLVISLFFLLGCPRCSKSESSQDRFENIKSINKTAGDRGEAEGFYKKGLSLYKKNNFEQAEIYFYKALIADPAWEDVYIDAACALYHQNDKELTLEYLRLGILLSPDKMIQLVKNNKELELLLLDKDFINLINEINSEIAINEQKELFNGYFFAGDRDKASKLHKKAMIEYKNKAYDAAYDLWLKTAEADPMWGRTYYNLACMCALLGYKETAFGYIDMALKLDPCNLYRKIKNDSDFASIKDLPEFKQRIDNVKINIRKLLQDFDWKCMDVDFHFNDNNLSIQLDGLRLIPGMFADHDYEWIDEKTGEYELKDDGPDEYIEELKYSWKLIVGSDESFYLNLRFKESTNFSLIANYFKPENYYFKIINFDYGSILLQETNSNKYYRLIGDMEYLRKQFGANYIDLLTYEYKMNFFSDNIPPNLALALTPLSRAILKKDKNTIKKLLQKGKKLNTHIIDPYNHHLLISPLYIFVNGQESNNLDYDFIKFLIKNGADVTMKGPEGRTPLHLAVQMSDFKLIDLLLIEGVREGEELNIKDNENHTPLYYLFENDDHYSEEKIASLLIKFGAKTNFTYPDGESFDEKYERLKMNFNY